MADTLILIPTYNERGNVAPLAEAVLSVAGDADLLFIDDASPDGTGGLLDRLAEDEPRVNVLHRPAKQGLGGAYLAGFRWSLERDYAYSVCMDADLSHAPSDLPRFRKALEKHDMVCGSRYMPGGAIRNWPRSRLCLSRAAAVYARLLTGMPFTDPTGGFNGYCNRMLRVLNSGDVSSQGYSFQIEMKHRAWMEGFTVCEIPIEFVERREGRSKLSAGILREAVWVVWKLVRGRGFRRRPVFRRSSHPDC